jgi:hypothetical protein
MIISDISHIEVATEDNKIQGGYAFADAYSNAYASGRNFAATYTSTSTSAYDTYYYYYYGSANASSGSTSHSSAS